MVDGQPEPFAIQLAGTSSWESRWLLIFTDENRILLFTDQRCEFNSFCGMLSGEGRTMKLVLDSTGWVRSYFKLYDPNSGDVLGTARCMKSTADKIVRILTT